MRILLPGALLAAILLLAGCASTEQGTPTASDSSPSDSRSASPTQSQHPSGSPKAPDVTDPIDTTAFEENPCSVLTKPQLNQLSIATAPKQEMTESGPSCKWGDVFDDGISISGAFITEKPSSINGLYRNSALERYSYFIPVNIDGYPAAFLQVADRRGNGSCGIGIGVRDELVYSISFRLSSEHPGYSDPCSVLKKVAEMTVQTMTQGDS